MTGPRQRKRDDTRRQLETAARALFDVHGYDGTTIEMIAERAGVSPRTFHRYFETKDGVVAEPGHRLLDRTIERLTPGMELPRLVELVLDEVSRGVVSGDLGWALRLHRLHPKVAQSAPLWHARRADRLARSLAAAEGRSRPTLADRLLASLTVTSAAVAIDRWIQGETGRELSSFGDEVLATLRDGLRV